uniref:Transmembrane protein n=1 Tax=Pithovirus LCPAC102 TaxID=2506587 RepID=A0A4D5XF56_9VIRU|nr:MAG: uncharacterized protein LCPAC102_01530 [Pithovirus LCPAC102]
MSSSFDTFEPSEDNDLTESENKFLNSIMYIDENDEIVKDSNNKNIPFYNKSYNNIIFVIIITIIFIILACPAVDIWFFQYVPDPYFCLLTKALIFFILVFIIDLILSYTTRNGLRNHDKY